MSVQGVQHRKVVSSLPTIRKIASQICANRDEVDDLVQDVSLKLLSNWQSIPEKVSFNWLFSCVRHVFIDKYRRRTREQRLLEKLFFGQPNDPADKFTDTSPEISSGTLPSEAWGTSSGTSPGGPMGTSPQTFLLPLARFYDYPELDPEFKLEINAFLNRLPYEHRASVLLLAEGSSYEEIAELTKTKLGTVRSRIHYLRKKAHRELSAFT